MDKLSWALIGGGEDSQIGTAHRIGACVDGRFELSAGAFDIDAERGKAFGKRLGVADGRAYGTWRELLDREASRPNRPDLVTVATPNATHHEITVAALRAGFHVLCEKPLTTTVPEAEEIVRLAAETNRICAVNYGYSGYPLVRQMRAMVADGELGEIRLVMAEFAHGFHADAGDADNPRVRWRYDPASAGVSSIFADCGIHALHLACFVTGQNVTSLSADFASCVAGRSLEDDALVAFRMSGGSVGRLWASAVAVGRMHGLTLQVFGERGGMRWTQEQPNQMLWTPTGQGSRIIERGADGLSPAAERASRVTIGHPEGMPLAFANIYHDLAEVIGAEREGRQPDPLATGYPTAADGLDSMRAIYASVDSAGHQSAWRDL